MKDCGCALIKEEEINSLARFKEIKSQFKQLTENGSLSEIPVSKPFYIGYGIEGDEHKWFADKWYKCKKCGAIWEFIFPDFPSRGSVKKLSI